MSTPAPLLRATEAESVCGDPDSLQSAQPARRATVLEMTPQARGSAQATATAQVSEIPAAGAALQPVRAFNTPGATANLITDFVELFKIRVVMLVVVTGWGGYYLGAQQAGVSSVQRGLLDALLGIGLVSAGAGALNEALERHTDARMKRTANRPIATGRMSFVQGLLAGFGAVALGALWLHLFANPLTEVLAVLTALLYTAVYTPLKRKTTWATFIGAFPGAMGPMLGWTAARGRIEWPAVALFAILFVWQFPHFMSIAWLYRRDYAQAGIRMLPVVHTDGRSTIAVSLLFAVLMIPVSLSPAALGIAGPLYVSLASALGIVYLAYTVRFARILRPISEEASRMAARDLLKVSVLYLPLLFTALMLCANRAH